MQDEESIEQFKVDGKFTRDTELNWLESKGILKRGTGIYKDSYALVYTKGLTEAQISQRFFQYQKMFEDYKHGMKLKDIGSMGVVKEVSAKVALGMTLPKILDTEDLPF